MKDSRSLLDLHPVFKDQAMIFINDYENKTGVKLLVTSTLRDEECQRQLYARGRTSPGQIVTNAEPGESFHNYGVALDAYPLVNGKPLFVTDRDGDKKVDFEWQAYKKIAKEHGLVTLSFEWPHVQISGFTIQDLKAGKLLTLKGA